MLYPIISYDDGTEVTASKPDAQGNILIDLIKNLIGLARYIQNPIVNQFANDVVKEFNQRFADDEYIVNSTPSLDMNTWTIPKAVTEDIQKKEQTEKNRIKNHQKLTL